MVRHIPSTASNKRTSQSRRVMQSNVIAEPADNKDHPGGESPKNKGRSRGRTRQSQTTQTEGKGPSAVQGPVTATTAPKDMDKFCVHHGVAGHSIFRCQDFRNLSYKSKIDRLRQLKRCEKCTGGTHRTEKCDRKLKCNQCSGCHVGLLHPFTDPRRDHEGDTGGNGNSGFSGNQRVLCTQVCNSREPVSCSDCVGRTDYGLGARKTNDGLCNH